MVVDGDMAVRASAPLRSVPPASSTVATTETASAESSSAAATEASGAPSAEPAGPATESAEPSAEAGAGGSRRGESARSVEGSRLAVQCGDPAAERLRPERRSRETTGPRGELPVQLARYALSRPPLLSHSLLPPGAVAPVD